MEIILVREPICAGDSAVEHKIIYNMSDDSTYEDLFSLMMNDRFLPSVTGSNEVWVLRNESHFCIFSYFTKTKQLRNGLSKKKLSEICKDSNELVLGYYDSPVKWRTHIAEKYKGDSESACRSGMMDEIIYCFNVMK